MVDPVWGVLGCSGTVNGAAPVSRSTAGLLRNDGERMGKAELRPFIITYVVFGDI